MRTIRIAGALGAATVITALALAPRVRAFNPQPDPPAFGMIAVTNEQTARLNVVAVGGSRCASTGEVQPGPCRCASIGDVAPGPCRIQATLTFFDANGQVLAQRVETLESGHAAFLDLNGATLGGGVIGDFSPRSEVRADVQVLGQPPPVGDRPAVVPTLEVFDNFGMDVGKTRVALAGRAR
jgi:hypothetical protein